MDRERHKRISEKQFEVSVHAMCDDILDSIKQDYEETPLESWDVYENRTRALLFDNIAIYQERFATGYQTLLFEIADMYRDGELQ